MNLIVSRESLADFSDVCQLSAPMYERVLLMERLEPETMHPAPPDVLAGLKTLCAMRDSPKSDWRMKDVERACGEIGIVCKAPKRGSHYRVRSELVPGTILTIPAAKPIKAPYIRQLVELAERHREAVMEQEAVDGS